MKSGRHDHHHDRSGEFAHTGETLPAGRVTKQEGEHYDLLLTLLKFML